MMLDEIRDDEEFEDDFEAGEDDFEDDWDDEAGIDDAVDDAPPQFEDTASPVQAEHSGNVNQGSGQKTFLQKFFIPIVVAIVAVFGGLFVLGSGILSGPDTAQPPAITETAADNTNAQDVAAQDTVTVESTAVVAEVDELPPLMDENQPEKPLTPFPGADPAVETERFELADLGAEIEDTISLQDNSNDVLSLDGSVGDGFANENNDFLDSNTEAQDDSLAMPDTTLSMPEQDETLTLTDTDDLVLDAPTEMMPSENVVEESATPDFSTPELGTNSISDIVSETTSDAQVERLTQENQKLKKDLADSQSELASLQNQIESLESRLASAQSTGKATKDPAPKVENDKPQSITDIIQDAPVVTKEPAPARRTARASANIRWVLKGAQPNQATLSNAGTGDLKHVEVGQSVSGLGRINSIRIENGLWVVRGTKGQVTQ